MMRAAEDRDIPEIRAFLTRHIESSMFLLGNLDTHGLHCTKHRHATRYTLCHDGAGLTGVFGATRAGFLMCQMPTMSAADARAFVAQLDDYTLEGMTGPADQVAMVLDALPVADEDWHLNEVEPLYSLDCARLPDTADTIRPPEGGDRDLLARWYAGYLEETGLATPAEAPAEGARRADEATGSPRHRLLIEDGRPVAVTQYSTRTGDAVQIGGVYVPPDLRGHGRAGRVVAAQLRALGGEGVARAILFAAAKAYERIGFRHIGTYAVAVLAKPRTLAVPA